MIESCVIRRSVKENVKKIQKKELHDVDSISNVVGNKKVSIFQYELLINGKKRKLIGKWKTRNIIKNGAIMLANHNLKSFFTILRNHKVLGYNQSYYRESYIYSNIDDSLKENFAKLYGTYTNKLFGNNFLLLEKFHVSNTISKQDLYVIIDAILKIHIFYYRKEKIVPIMKLNDYSTKDYRKCIPTLQAIFNACEKENICDYGKRNTTILKKFIENINSEFLKYSFHRTLTHNDLSNRNICYSRKKCYFFDWEMACFQNPEHDLIDILVSNLELLKEEEIFLLIQYYQKKLLTSIPCKIDKNAYLDIVLFNLKEYMVNKLSMLRVFNKEAKLEFITSLTNNSNRLLNLLLKEKKI